MLAIDTEKRQIRLSMKQLVPAASKNISSSIRKAMWLPDACEVSGEEARRRIGEGIQANCQMHAAGSASPKNPRAQPELSSSVCITPQTRSVFARVDAAGALESGPPAGAAEPDSVRAGQFASSNRKAGCDGEED